MPKFLSLRRSGAVVASLVMFATVAAPTSAQAARLVPTDRPTWVPGVLSGTLLAIDPTTGLTERTLQGGTNPFIVAPSPDGRTLYVDNLPRVGSGSGITFVDAPTGASTFLKFPGIAADEILDPTGRYLYVADIVYHEVVKIDTTTRAIVARFTFPGHVADEPLGIEISPDGKTLYVAWLAGWLGAYSASTGATIHEVALPSVGATQLGSFGQLALPGWLMLSPDGTRLYALNFATGNTTVWSTSTWTQLGVINNGPSSLPILASFSPDGSLYFTDYGTRQLQVVDTHTLQTTEAITLSGRPIGVATNTDGTVTVDTISPGYNSIDPLTPIAALVVVGGLTPLTNVHLGNGSLQRFAGPPDQLQLLSNTPINDTVPGAFVAPPFVAPFAG